jgi:predicted ABC-type ATPase
MKKALLTMGLPAAGKSTILNRDYNVTGCAVIDPDEIKKEKSDYDPKKPEIYHAWSQQQAKLRITQAIANNNNIIIDGTGTNVEKMYKQITELQSSGYEVELLYVSVSLKTSLERNAKRERNVPENIILEKYDTITYAFEILSKIADNITVINND